MNARHIHVSATGNANIAAANSGAILWSVNVNTAATSAVLRVYNNVSAVAADLVAVIDATSLGSWWYGIYCPKGIYYDLSGGNADVTLGYA